MRPVSAKIRNCTQLSTRRRERDNSGTREAILSKLLLSIAGCCRFLRYCEGAPLPRCNRSGPCQLLPIALPQSDGGRQSNALKQNIRVALSSRAKCWDFVPKFWDFTPRPQIFQKWISFLVAAPSACALLRECEVGGR